MDEPVRVGIGLIERGGCYLIRRRPPLPGSPMPGVWEFPGGKCEPGESPPEAAARECREETGLFVRVVALRHFRTHRYPHGMIELHYYDCETEGPTTEPVAGSGFVWVESHRLPDLTFPEANAPILQALAEEGRRRGDPRSAG